MLAKNPDKVIAIIPKFICRLNHPKRPRIITIDIPNITPFKRIAYNSIIWSLSSSTFFSYLPAMIDENIEITIESNIDASMLIPTPRTST